MAFRKKPRGRRIVPSARGVLKIAVLFVVAASTYGGMTFAAHGPNVALDEPRPEPRQYASIDYEGVDPVITGSVGHMFHSSGFVGPNRDEKTDRARPEMDLVAMAENFNKLRLRLASLDDSPFDPATPQSRPGMPALALAEARDDADEGPRMTVASLDTRPGSSALDAIEEASPVSDDPSVPTPTALPDQLAYARANTPATERIINAFSERERWCLATAIYFEARGESYRGQAGVAQVIMNRVDHRLYPDSICGVVFQNQHWRNRCQFSFACDGIPEHINEQEPWRQAQSIADKVTAGSLYLSEVADATHYHANYVYPHWAPRMTKITRIGLHIFYRFRRG